MRLIVTEKNNSAKKIAENLGTNVKTDQSFKVPFYTWSDEQGDHTVIGLKGHAVEVAFPEGYDNWQKTDVHELIDADLVKRPTDKNVIRAMRKQAEQADELVIATDYDREGELIGLETLEEALEVNPDLAGSISRARYSALTKDEIERAFNDLDHLSYPLAHAGAARQDIDLIWGAALTRAVSLATRRFGSNYLSVGRVQSPTLGLIVEREMERRAHVPEPYWELLARFRHPEGSVLQAHHATDKFWDRAEAERALGGTAGPGRVTEVSSRRNSRKPPTPYNTTAFTTDASSRLGITPAAAMRIAEDLYMDGFISYPRTDNTVYPSSLPIRETIASLVRIPEFSAAAPLLEGKLQPTRGKKETTDHPPIYPTQAVYPNALDGPKQRVYELVVRRFLATFSPPMVTESTRADIQAGSESFFVRGSVVIDPGFAGIYTYARSADEELPTLEQGQELPLEGDPWLEEKETQPPPRLSQGKLIEMMEERGLGTKATRAEIIQKLYNRGYVRNNPPEPSATGIAMYEAFKKYVPRMATAEMTAQLESEMDLIATGEMSKDEVVSDSRELLHTTYDEIREGEEALAKEIWAGMDADRILGPCIACKEAGRTRPDGSPNMLRIIKARKSGKFFVGCQGWDPEDPGSCDQTFPMPQPRFYDVHPLEETCTVCGRAPRVQVSPRGSRGRPWKLCFNEECPTMVEMREKKAARQAAREAEEAAAGEGGGSGEETAAAGAASTGGSDGDGAATARGSDGKGGSKGKGKGGRRSSKSKPSPGTRRVKRAGSKA